ncbi:secretin N-terminal domain-containing protein [Simkania negevensis]|nr:secretin N-terminal domain-containing protein [Simkania negevensis]
MMKSKVLRLLTLTSFVCCSSLHSVPKNDPEMTEATEPERSVIPPETGPGYTINFNNVSIIEYIKFISKIANLNFIYDEKDLQFNVTIVSEEATSLVNVMSALIQVLKVNGFGVVEQGNNLLITRSGTVSQIATVVSQESPLAEGHIPPIMTRVFKIKNTNPSIVGQLISPLLSKDAVLEVSAQTRHVIITDITQNIEEIQKLLLTLDAAKSPLNIDSYTTRNNSPETLIDLANQIIIPISEGNPIIYVPQDQTNTIFIVSTPYLIEKSIMIFEDLDNPPSLTQRFSGPITGSNILIYHIENKPADVLQQAVQGVQAGLAKLGPPSQSLVQTLSTMRYIRESHSLAFIGTPATLSEVQNLLTKLDVPYTPTELEYLKSSFYLYTIKNGDEKQISRSLDKFVQTIKKSDHPPTHLIETIESMQWIKENNSLLFYGDDHSISRLKEILPTFDTPIHQGKTSGQLPLSNDFYVYTPKNLSGEALLKQIKDIDKSLKTGNLADPAFLHALSTAEWVPSTQSLVFTGDPQSLDRVHALLNTIDQQKGPAEQGSTFYIYKVTYVQPGFLEQGLQKTAKSLPKGSTVAVAIDNSKYIPDTNSFVFQGTPTTINHIKDIIGAIDTQQNAEVEASHKVQYFVYRLQQAPGSFVMQELDQTAKSLKGSNLDEKQLIEAIHNITWNKQTNSLILTGTDPVLTKLKGMIAKYDIPTAQEPSQFYVYRPSTMSAADYLTHIKEVANEMQASGLVDETLINSLQNARLVPDKTAVMFTGTPTAIEKMREVAPTFDTSTRAKATQLFVYKPISMDPQQFQKNMIQTGADLKKSGLHDAPLINSFNSARVSSDGNTVIFTGTPDAIAKLQTMVPTIDEENEAEQANKIYLYTPINRSPEDIRKAAIQAASEMQSTINPNTSLITALRSGKIVGHEKSILFTGTPEAVARLKELVPAFDNEKPATTSFFVYKPKSISAVDLQKRSIQVAGKLQEAGLNDPQLLEALESAKLSPAGDSVTYVGTPSAIDRLENMIPTYDSGIQAEKATQYYVYQPKNLSAEEFQQRMTDAGSTLKESGLADPNLIRTLKTSQITSGGKAVLFTGTPESIASIKELAEKYDLHQQAPEKATEFFIYTPKSMSADELRRHVRLFAENMEAADLADPALLKTLNNTKLVSNGKSVLFTGTEASINGVKTLLPTIDQEKEEDVKTVGKTTFTVYKIKYVSGPALMGYLRDLANDFQRAQSSDTGLIQTLQNMRFVKETNSIIFTGTPKDLKEATALAAKFDISELAGEQPVRAPSGYLIYKPKNLSGQQLILILRDFEQNLLTSGVNDSLLFDTINNLKWMQQVSSIVITGSDQDTQKVYALLERFDTPAPGIPGEDSGIENISDMSFLIYKLQYHSGGEIQSALQKIGDDLSKIKSDKVNQGLVDAIKAVQWIEVTNSLISTGESDSLAKLKELIKSIDIPLRQVFVEILVIETDIANTLNFGLRWGSQGVYRNKFAYGTGSFPQPPGQNAPDPLANFNAGLQSITATTTPTGQMIPFVNGFDLGVIGDIILHKGQTYFSLGSVVDALKADNDSTIALNQKIITQDNKNASIFVGQNLPYTGSVVQNVGTNTTVTNSNLEYRDVGVSLSITPQIGDNDTVTLNINQEITENISNNSSSSPITLNGIATSKTTTQTSVTVPDKAFLIISGQIDNTLSQTRTSIPCLGGLPLIGAAFSQSDSLTNKNSIIIFVRPHIIKSYDVYKEITANQEELHRAQTDNVEAFDAGLELVKTPDDY